MMQSGSKKSDVNNKCKKAVGLLSENLYILANEPSSALYYIQEHVRKEVPVMVKHRYEFNKHHRQLQGICYDCDYNIGAIKSIEKTQGQFDSITEHLKSTLFYKQQLKFEENRRKLKTSGKT